MKYQIVEKCGLVSGQLKDEAIYRRGQFYLGPKESVKFTNWNRYTVNSDTYLTAHPSVNVVNKHIGMMHATLIGFVIDPDCPEASNEDVVTALLAKLTHVQQSFPHTYRLGGRYILIIGGVGDTIIFTDATGNRQMFYTDKEVTNKLWCASEPGILSEICKLKPDPAAQSFMDSPEFKNNYEYWWPGDTSPFSEVRRLLPNHYLNLTDGMCIRYWPDKPLTPKSSKQAARCVATTIKSLVKGASTRGDLSVSITAGLDSRMVLAASKHVVSCMSFMTVQQKGMSIDHADLVIPKRILSELGLSHSVINLDRPVRENFRHYYGGSVLYAHEKWLPDAQEIFDYNYAKKVAVSGSVAEVARLFYRAKLLESREKITPMALAAITKMGNHPFVIAAFERWLNELGETYNYEIADLLYWEQRAGSWLASCQLEFGLVWEDIFTPFNCRSLLIEMLGVDKRLRKPPDSIFFKDVIQLLWPKLLDYPINSHHRVSRRNRFRQVARRIALRLITN